ncbi:hypothetical protein MKW98_024968 [Papaver atlanticum]|uniref:Glabrous enhancer-binding protein-like DBD domain-containing protein n=1 Tax=Papaver atlanticum TaxID=357466 RepID=A0AAD4T1U2_9MAGN|nr:hypothetical protein MKW98_024968 [Papaver atlanticum]
MDLLESRLLKNPSTPYFIPNPTSIPKRSVSRPKPTPASTTTEKPHVVEAEKSEKQEKKKNNYAGSDSKKDGRRVWKRKIDEILLLKGMADRVKRGENPKTVDFFRSIKPYFSVDVNLDQIRSKIRHFEDAYNKNEKAEKEGTELWFGTPHLKACHEWSKMIWGSGGEPEDGGGDGEGSETVGVEDDGNAASAAEEQEENNVEEHAVAANQEEGEAGKNKERNKKKRKADSVLEDLIGQSTKAPLGLGSVFDEKALQLIESSKLMALQQKWKKSRIAEMELFLERNELAREGALLVLEALKAPPS